MNKLLKYTTAIGSATFALAFAVTAASAQTTDVINTGDDVEIEAGSEYELDVRVENRNKAFIGQGSANFVNTGNNDTDGNIGGGSIDSGNAVVANRFEAQANANSTTIDTSGFGSNGSDTTASIVNTGDDLEAELGSEYEVEVDVENDNRAIVLQGTLNAINTGNNEADENIGGGDIDSGNAGVLNEFSTQVNSNRTNLDGFGALGGGSHTLDLVNTGDDLEVEMGSEYEVEVDVENDNRAFVLQAGLNFLNTGENDTDDNVFGGDINSGDAIADNRFEVMANSNRTNLGFGNLFGGSDSESTLTNTGDDLEYESETEVEVEVDVENDNAGAKVQVTVNGAQTGGNEADENVFGGDTNSGEAGVWNDFLAELNSNWTEIN